MLSCFRSCLGIIKEAVHWPLLANKWPIDNLKRWIVDLSIVGIDRMAGVRPKLADNWPVPRLGSAIRLGKGGERRTGRDARCEGNSFDEEGTTRVGHASALGKWKAYTSASEGSPHKRRFR